MKATAKHHDATTIILERVMLAMLVEYLKRYWRM